MKFGIIGLMILSCLTSCETANFDSLAVPDVVEYSIETQKEAAQELENNSVPVLNEFMKDYNVMRDQARAAR